MSKRTGKSLEKTQSKDKKLQEQPKEGAPTKEETKKPKDDAAHSEAKGSKGLESSLEKFYDKKGKVRTEAVLKHLVVDPNDKKA